MVRKSEPFRPQKMEKFGAGKLGAELTGTQSIRFNFYGPECYGLFYSLETIQKFHVIVHVINLIIGLNVMRGFKYLRVPNSHMSQNKKIVLRDNHFYYCAKE